MNGEERMEKFMNEHDDDVDDIWASQAESGPVNAVNSTGLSEAENVEIPDKKIHFN